MSLACRSATVPAIAHTWESTSKWHRVCRLAVASNSIGALAPCPVSNSPETHHRGGITSHEAHNVVQNTTDMAPT